MTPSVCREVDNRHQYVSFRSMEDEIRALREEVRRLRGQVRDMSSRNADAVRGSHEARTPAVTYDQEA
jgi:hypothetical protein